MIIIKDTNNENPIITVEQLDDLLATDTKLKMLIEDFEIKFRNRFIQKYSVVNGHYLYNHETHTYDRNEFISNTPTTMINLTIYRGELYMDASWGDGGNSNTSISLTREELLMTDFEFECHYEDLIVNRLKELNMKLDISTEIELKKEYDLYLALKKKFDEPADTR